MFKLFKKKDEKISSDPTQSPIAIRDTLLGVLPPAEWPKGNVQGYPWSLFVEARDQIAVRKNFNAAINIYKKIVETPGLESRHYLQAWQFLRKLKIVPPPELARKVYGVLVDVYLESGPEFVVGYADHSARYAHASGSGVIWDAPDDSLNGKVDALLKACEAPAARLQPLDNGYPSVPKQAGAVQICILTPGGIHHGIGTFEGWSKDEMGGPIMVSATDLMKSLTEINRSK